MNSTFGNQHWAQNQTATLFLTTDARARGNRSWRTLRVEHEACYFVAQNGTVRRGVVLAPSVRWNELAPDHRNVNVLTSDRLSDIGGGPTFYSCLVDVEVRDNHRFR